MNPDPDGAAGRRVRAAARGLLAPFLVFAGAMHFVKPTAYAAVMPPYLPAPLLLVSVSGAAEITGGLGVLVPGRVRRLAGWGLTALLVAVFPANLHMAMNGVTPPGVTPIAPLLLWLRLPLQPALIAWVWWCTLAREA